MIKKTFKIAAILCAAIWAQSVQAQAQQQVSINPDIKGNIRFSARNVQLKQGNASAELQQWLGLSNDYNFVQIKEKTDHNGITHTSFEQLYKGVKVNNAMVIIHSKAGFVKSITGKIMQSGKVDLNLNPSFDIAKAKSAVIEDLSILPGGQLSDVGLVIYMNDGAYYLAHKINVNARNAQNLLIKYNVYVDAHTGVILGKVPLIANADVPATALTYYSGLQPIMTESIDGGLYRLRDNTRNIETYDAAGQMPENEAAIVYPEARDVTHSSTEWNEQLFIMAMELTMADPEIISNLGFSFSTFAGNVLSNTIERDSDISVLARNNYFGLDGEPSIPYTNSNLFIPAVEGETYTGRFFKDSIGVNFGTGEIEFRGIHEASAVSFPITATTAGTFDWADAAFNEGTYTISLEKHPALDVHWGISRTYDFFDENFDYQSYDGEGGVIRNYYNGTSMMMGTQNNAAALQAPQNAMVYGTGDGVDFKPFVTLDVTAHEFTHLIMSNTANLEYSGESGALNEAFSDIMGTAVEFFAKGESGNWTIGEDLCITVPYMRSMSNPNAPASFEGESAIAIPQPDTYNGTYWAPTGSSDPDNGGVHINSGVANYWYYLLSEGGTGTNDLGKVYNVPAIGIDKATNIAFASFTNYMTATSDFHDAYAASLEAAADIYGDESAEYDAVEEAWYAVGIPYTLSVQNIPTFAQNINVYPNPNNGQFIIKNDATQELKAEIVNVLGVVVHGFTLDKGINDVNVTLPAGNYFVQFTASNGEKYSSKIVVK